jgi:KaiC/GvpD/RAD55 family RecA-like ATPase
MQETLSLPESLAPVVHMTEQAVDTGRLGAIAARAGVGKTSFLVQVALHAMLRGQNVLHINLNDPLQKTVLWYKEVFSRLIDKYSGLGETVNLDMILGRRFIMTMKVGEFSVAAIQERLSDFIEQEIFAPQLLLVDGLNFDEPQDETVSRLKDLTREFSLRTWVAMSVHREEARDESGLPVRLSDLAGRFDLIWELLPESGKININLLKGQSASDCFLDPLSLLLQI